ncbi:360_t:CDS:2, partial [Racocetra fulgida]
YIDLGSSISSEEKHDGHIYGVLPYLAPEVLQGEKFTQAADIYSFGIIMIEILTGQRPFDGYSFDAELAAMICHGSMTGIIIRVYEDFVMLSLSIDKHKYDTDTSL